MASSFDGPERITEKFAGCDACLMKLEASPLMPAGSEVPLSGRPDADS